MKDSDDFIIRVKKLDYLYTNLPSAMLGATAIALIVYFTIKSHVNLYVLNIWLTFNR